MSPLCGNLCAAGFLAYFVALSAASLACSACSRMPGGSWLPLRRRRPRRPVALLPTQARATMDGGPGHSRDPRLASPGGSFGISIKTEGTWDAAPVAGQGKGLAESPAAATSPSTDEEPPLCSLCHLGEEEDAMLGPLLEFDWSTPKRRATALVHQLCAAWAPRAHASDAVSGAGVAWRGASHSLCWQHRLCGLSSSCQRPTAAIACLHLAPCCCCSRGRSMGC